MEVNSGFMRIAVVAAVVWLIFGQRAIAGPPLSIDDPGIVEPWHWEVIGAATVTSGREGDYWQLPVLDISLGVIKDSVQVGFVYPYAHADTGDGGIKSDFGNAEVGVKWRFYASEHLQMAFAPYYAFGVSRRIANKGIGAENDAAVWPINAEYRINDRWSLNGELRYISVQEQENAVGYGAAVAFAANARWMFMFEFAGESDTDFSDEFHEVRAGFDVALTDSFHLLFSLATGVKDQNSPGELDYDVFLGLQYLQ